MSAAPHVVRVLVGIFLAVLAASFVVTVPASAATDAKLVLVLDSSGSMKEKVGGQSKISIAKASLRTVIGKLPADAPVGLRVYGATVFDKRDKGACTDSQLVVPIGTNNRSAMREEIGKYKPFGETPISYSLIQAAKDLGKDGKRSILLVSDGEETCAADPCKTAAAIAKNDIKVKIDVVGLAVSGRVRSKLQCIADKGNGSYYDARTRTDLEDSLDKLATRAFRPFRLTGTPIEGSTKKKDAPTAAPGQYVDRIPGNVKAIYYRIPRTAPGSTLHLGFTARPTGEASWVTGVFLKLYDAKGRECGSGYGSAVGAGTGDPLLTADTASWANEETAACNTDSELIAKVEAAQPWMGGIRFELLVREEPPVVSVRRLPAATSSIRWQKMRPAAQPTKAPVPGTSISDAPLLAPGTYRASILTNETQVFAVNLDWGQRAQVTATVAPRRGALARNLGILSKLDLELLGPMRGRYVNQQISGKPEDSNSMSEPAKTFHQTGSTPTVRFLNRNLFDSTASSTLPGPQYIVLNMASGADRKFLVRYTLQVEVVGKAGSGAPEYVGGPTPTPTPTASPTPVATEATQAPPAQANTGVPIAGVVGIGLAAVALGVGGGLVVARRRRQGGVS